MNLNDQHIEKLFHLAGINLPENATAEQLTQALIEIEKKLATSNIVKSQLNSESAPNILVIDDLELSIHQLTLLLTKSGYNVHIARSVDEARQQLKKQSYDYVLVDLFIPEPEDGFSIIDLISNSDKAKEADTKIIVISGTDDKNHVNLCFQKGANEFVEKSPEWHKKIISYINRIENQKSENRQSIEPEIIDEKRKIILICVKNITVPVQRKKLEKIIVNQVNAGYVNIILDMKNVNSMDSASTGVLITGYKQCSEHGGVLKLCNVDEAVKEALSYVYLDNVIGIYSDKNAAVNSF